MNDLFARTGIILEHLLNQSTLNGDVKAEGLRLAAELKVARDDIGRRIDERVQAAVEAVVGRLEALEAGKRAADAVVFSRANLSSLEGASDDPAEMERLWEVFNGADPARFDHDADGTPGGSTPAAPTDVVSEMTVAQLKAALDEKGIGYPSDARKADLQGLLAAASGPETVSGT